MSLESLGVVLKATTTPLQTSPEHTTSKEATGGTSNHLGTQAPRVTSQWGRNVAENAIWFGQDVDRVLLSQSPKFQQVWVEGLRVLSKPNRILCNISSPLTCYSWSLGS